MLLLCGVTRKTGYSFRSFMGHSTTVKTLDFTPTKEDLLCSCDNNSWNGSYTGFFKGGATQMRFQPCLGRILAADDNLVSIYDVETQLWTLNYRVIRILSILWCCDSYC